ncbi:serine protease [Bacteroidales bacterium OttesenSCG-928-E04]|nr:serine protease [Bacteroidales bacterium OttesenSCG-928-E04]MDL2326553.1 serine protease [Bacteroidales bacterium OttesenSCG-928-A14]
MSIALIITLILLGIILVILEILIVPGLVVGILGFLMMVGGIIAAYTSYGALAGNIVLASTLIISVILFVLILRTKTWKKLTLKTNIDSKMNTLPDNGLTVGMEGVAVSRLAPMGKGKFGNEIVEVTSQLGFVDVNNTIVITKIESNKVYVKLK